MNEIKMFRLIPIEKISVYNLDNGATLIFDQKTMKSGGFISKLQTLSYVGPTNLEIMVLVFLRLLYKREAANEKQEDSKVAVWVEFEIV